MERLQKKSDLYSNAQTFSRSAGKEIFKGTESKGYKNTLTSVLKSIIFTIHKLLLGRLLSRPDVFP